MAGRPLRLLLVDDNPLEALLVENAVQDCEGIEIVHIARDGEEAIDCLRRMGQNGNDLLPDLILLDLHMPRKSGFEVLKDIKKNARLMSLPVIFLTSSDSADDIVRSYADGASTFFTKPPTFEELECLLNDLARYWFKAGLPEATCASQELTDSLAR